MASKIEYAGQRAQQLTQKLLGFARQGKHQHIAVDLAVIVDETVSLIQMTIEGNIILDVDLVKNIAHTAGDPVQIQQVVLNLCINARDAMALDSGGTDGGHLRISTELVEVSPQTADLGAELAAGSYICLTVADTGIGIDPEIQTKIFDPYFTTKKPGKGTGMGLAMVYGIVENHGGTIRLSSAPGCGTTFRVYFPAITGDSVPSAESQRPDWITGKGNILLVDDDDVTREVTTDMLERLGYCVTAACDGEEAIEYYQKDWSNIDLLILDMVMPRIGGKECFLACRKINPQVSAILTTGYDANNAVQDVLNQGMVGFIQKPYRLEVLSEEVANALRISKANSASARLQQVNQ